MCHPFKTFHVGWWAGHSISLIKGEGISLTPHYHFHPLHKQLDISWAITAESSTSAHSQQLESNQEPLVSEQGSRAQVESPSASTTFQFPPVLTWV